MELAKAGGSYRDKHLINGNLVLIDEDEAGSQYCMCCSKIEREGCLRRMLRCFVKGIFMKIY